MRSNFELWKKGNLPMFITSFKKRADKLKLNKINKGL